jgi:hypothetical protein
MSHWVSEAQGKGGVSMLYTCYMAMGRNMTRYVPVVHYRVSRHGASDFAGQRGITRMNGLRSKRNVHVNN